MGFLPVVGRGNPSPLESDMILFDCEQAVVGNRDAMSIAADVIEHLLGTGKRSLGVDDPLGLLQRSDGGAKRVGIA